MSDVSAIHRPANWGEVLVAPFSAGLKYLMIFQRARHQAAIAHKLIDLSDEELAKRGLARNQISKFVADLPS